jgi:hypothetical protein
MSNARNPFSPLNAPAEVRLRALLKSRGIDPATVTSTTWCGGNVFLFVKGSQVPLSVAVSDFSGTACTFCGLDSNKPFRAPSSGEPCCASCFQGFSFGATLPPKTYAMTLGDVVITVTAGERESDGRTPYAYRMTGAGIGGDCRGTDLHSGCQGGTAEQGMESLLSFLGHDAERVEGEASNPNRHTMDSDLCFPRRVAEWASRLHDVISLAEMDLSESAQG